MRRDCKVITGDLEFSLDFAESINFDGVEEIQGNIHHFNKECRDEYCPPPLDFDISCSTLTRVGGYIYFWQFLGLRSLLLPNLIRVEGGVFFRRLHELTRLDITKLAYLGHFLVEASNLTTLDHDVLEGFTSEDNSGGITFEAAAVDSVDSFFKRPLKLNITNNGKSYISAFGGSLPNVRNITLGWSRVADVLISGDNLRITLGTSNTTDIEIGNLKLYGNMTALEYHPKLNNLTIGNFYLGGYRGDISATELDMQFTNISSININKQSDLQIVRVPPQAELWEDLSINIEDCDNLNLSSEYIVNDNGEKERVWYWPQSDIRSIRFSGNPISTDFL